jgi:tetratricopeptide (TPR) repeat protein
MRTPERWSARLLPNERAEDVEDVEARAGLLLRRAIVKQPLPASTLADIRSRLPNGEGRASPRRLAFRIGVAFVLFLSGGGVVASATLLRHWSPFRRAPAGAPATATPTARPARHARPTPAPTTPATTPPTRELLADPAPPATGPAVPEVSRRPPAPRPFKAAAPAPEVMPPPSAQAARSSAIAEEAALVGAALRKLREHDDATGALALLDEHDLRFAATGALSDEAGTTRVEALLRLGRHARALALLDAREPRPTGRGRELLATRGELRADAGRCREALVDFDAALNEDATDGIAERALYGRAACRSRLGAVDAARADLEDYVARFPSGRFATRARAALNR